MKILICGFMGSGKSTMLRKFQMNDLGYDCIDLDDALAVDLRIRSERLGDWILQNGFPLFRDLEKTKLKKLLNLKGSLVIALGGGALNPEIINLLPNNHDYRLVFLDTDFDVCLSRIKGDKTRPMSQIGDEELKRLYESRRKDYLKADLVLNEEEIKEIEGLGSLVHNLSRY